MTNKETIAMDFKNIIVDLEDREDLPVEEIAALWRAYHELITSMEKTSC